MRTIRSTSLVAAVAIVLAAASLAAAPESDTAGLRGQQYTQERQAAVEALGKHDDKGYRDALLKLHTDFPYNARALRNLAAAEAQVGDLPAAAAWLREYAAMGMTLDLQTPAFAPLRGTAPDIPRLARNAEPVSQSDRVFGIPDTALLPEDIAFDPGTKRFLLTSVRQRKVVSCHRAGKCEDVIKSSNNLPLDAMLAIHVDARRHLLWTTTAGMNAAAGSRPEEDGRSSLLKFDLPTFRLIKRYSLEDGRKHALGDMVLASNGDAYVSDGLSGDIFAVSTQRDELVLLVPTGTFKSPQTPVLSADEKFLYVPDYAAGLAILRLADKHVDWVTSAVPVALDGIDGMYRVGNRLIAVQNGTSPERIVSFHLRRPDQIDGFEVLEANWPGLGDPTHGVLIGSEFYFISNSGWDHLDDKGVFTPAEPAAVRKMKLTSKD